MSYPPLLPCTEGLEALDHDHLLPTTPRYGFGHSQVGLADFYIFLYSPNQPKPRHTS